MCSDPLSLSTTIATVDTEEGLSEDPDPSRRLWGGGTHVDCLAEIATALQLGDLSASLFPSGSKDLGRLCLVKVTGLGIYVLDAVIRQKGLDLFKDDSIPRIHLRRGLIIHLILMGNDHHWRDLLGLGLDDIVWKTRPQACYYGLELKDAP